MRRALAGGPVFLSRKEYRAWAEEQPRGRTERISGEVVSMAPERLEHIRAKARAWRALDQAIRSTSLSCEAIADGITIEVGDDTDYEPDAVVNCGEPMAGDVIAASNPVVVVEVLSPSTRTVDTGAKLSDYFRVPSIHHYLILRADRRGVIYHCRRNDGGIETRLLTEGRLRLDPPGISVSIEEFYAE